MLRELSACEDLRVSSDFLFLRERIVGSDNLSKELISRLHEEKLRENRGPKRRTRTRTFFFTARCKIRDYVSPESNVVDN